MATDSSKMHERPAKMSGLSENVKQWLFIERTYRLPRLWSNSVLQEICPLFAGEIINVSGWDDRDKEGSFYREYFTNAGNYYISNHEGKRGLADANDQSDFEINLAGSIPTDLERRFDVVFNHTTLEHIYDVRTAFRNLCLLSNDVMIVVAPFAQEMHSTDSYGDYWRFTPMCLRELFKENGFTVIFETISPF